MVMAFGECSSKEIIGTKSDELAGARALKTMKYNAAILCARTDTKEVFIIDLDRNINHIKLSGKYNIAAKIIDKVNANI